MGDVVHPGPEQCCPCESAVRSIGVDPDETNIAGFDLGASLIDVECVPHNQRIRLHGPNDCKRRIGEHDRERHGSLTLAHIRERCGVPPCDCPFYRGFVQHGALGVGISGQKNRGAAALKRGRVELRHPLVVRLETNRFQVQIMKGWGAASGDQDAFEFRNARLSARPREARSAAILLNLQLHAQMYGKFPIEHGLEGFSHLGVAQRREVITLIEHSRLDA
jgi:hypothetical protein